jgi:hypothetical protein
MGRDFSDFIACVLLHLSLSPRAAVPAEQQKAFVGFEFNVDVKLFLEKQRRDENLAGLNLSHMGPGNDVVGGHLSTAVNSNASHMIDGNDGQLRVVATGTEPSPKQGGNTLQLPGASSTAGASGSSSSGSGSGSGNGGHVSPPAIATQAALHATTVPPLASINRPATDPSAIEGAHVPPSSARTGSSSAKYEVAANTHDVAAAAAAAPTTPAGGGISSRREAAPLSARGARPASAAGQPLTEIPFTRHAVAASPRREPETDTGAQ